jgi:AraC family transcriptional regulator, transcriptional activator FtrA
MADVVIQACDVGIESRPALRRVAVIVDEGVATFELAIPCEVFGVDRSSTGLPKFEFFVCSPEAGPVMTSSGFQVIAPHRLDPVETADLVVVPPCGEDYVPPPAIAAALQRAAARGAMVASLCTGAFTLARAGLLDGRRATTHWFHEDEFVRTFPTVEFVCDKLYIEDGPISTSAGTAAGIDLCLHLVRKAYGAAAANGIARRMIVPPHRDGGQAQFVEAPVRPREADTLAPVLDWAAARLDEDLSVSRLAAQAAMSERTFARRFRDETGTTPHQWVMLQRVALAERLLEAGGMGVEEVARRCGFGSAAMLRHHFARLRRTTPTAYRRTFGENDRMPLQTG